MSTGHTEAVDVNQATVALFIVTGVLAIATIVLAGIAIWSLVEAHKLAKAAEASAEAADASIHELQRDRELAWQPHVLVEPLPGELWRLKNIGRGPAYRCRIVHPLEHRAAASARVESNEVRLDVAAGQETAGFAMMPHLETTEVACFQTGLPAGFTYNEPEPGNKLLPLCVCEDQLGACYLFQQGQEPAHWPDREHPRERPPWTRYRATPTDTVDEA
jgi:hypothetical protein